jgi:hypothetical protein
MTAARSPGVAVIGVCAGLSVLSLLIPYGISSDLWAWLVWGREVGHLALDPTPGPSWKPLPVVLTTVLAPFGSAAPALLLAVLRAAWLLAIILAYRIGHRLAGPTAGGIAAAGLLLVPDPSAPWLEWFMEGAAEPLVALLVLAAIDRHLTGHRLVALALGCAAALGRPEAWPVALVYALVTARTQPGARKLAAAGMVGAVPLLWAADSLVGAGDPLAPATAARSIVEGRRQARGEEFSKLGDLLNAGVTVSELLVVPLALAALAAPFVPRGERPEGRGAHRVALALLAGAGAWIAIAAAGTLFGLPALERFLLAPAAVLSVLAGVGIVETVRRVRPSAARTIVAVGLGALILGFALPRLQALPVQARPQPASRDERESLARLVERSRARAWIPRCGGRVILVKAGAAHSAWLLGVPLRAVSDAGEGRILRSARGVLIVGGASPTLESLGQTAAGPPRPVRRLGSSAQWSIYGLGCRSGEADAHGPSPSAAARRR